MDQLSGAVRAVGGARAVTRCGTVTTGAFQVTPLAWRLHVPIERVVLYARAPGTIFRPALTPVGPVALEELPFREVAQNGSWQILSTCAPPQPH